MRLILSLFFAITPVFSFSSNSHGQVSVSEKIGQMGLQGYEQIGRSVSNSIQLGFFLINDEKQVPTFSHVWKRYEDSKLFGMIEQRSEVEEITQKIPLLTALDGLVKLASDIRRNANQNLADRNSLAYLSIGILHVASMREAFFGEKEFRFRSMFKVNSMYPLGAINSNHLGKPHSEIVLAMIYSAFEGFPVDWLEQIRGMIWFALQDKSPRLRNRLASSFLAYSLPRSTGASIFPHLELQIRHRLSVFVVDNYNEDFDSSIEEFLSISLNTAKALYSPELISQAKQRIIRVQIGATENIFVKFKLCVAWLAHSISFEFWTLGISISLFLFQFCRSIVREAVVGIHQSSIWIKISEIQFKDSFGRAYQSALGQISFATASFSFGVLFSKIDLF